MKKVNIAVRFFGVIGCLLGALYLVGCVAAIPVAVMYYEDSLKYVAKADLRVPAEKVYTTAVSMEQERKLTMLKKDDKERLIEVTNGQETVTLKVAPISSDKSEMTVTSNAPKAQDRKEEEKRLAFQVIDYICAKLNVKYKLVRQ